MLRRPRSAIFAGIIKIVTIIFKTTVKDPKKLTELQIMYQKPIYICIS